MALAWTDAVSMLDPALSPEAAAEAAVAKWQQVGDFGSSRVTWWLSTLARARQPRAVALVLQALRAQGFEANTIHYNVAISAGEAPQWRMAVELLDSLQAAGLRPDAFTCSAVIAGCSKAETWMSHLHCAAR